MTTPPSPSNRNSWAFRGKATHWEISVWTGCRHCQTGPVWSLHLTLPGTSAHGRGMEGHWPSLLDCPFGLCLTLHIGDCFYIWKPQDLHRQLVLPPVKVSGPYLPLLSYRSLSSDRNASTGVSEGSHSQLSTPWSLSLIPICFIWAELTSFPNVVTSKLNGCLFFVSLAFIFILSSQQFLSLKVNICVFISSTSYENRHWFMLSQPRCTDSVYVLFKLKIILK